MEVCVVVGLIWRSEDNMQGSVLSFNHVDLGVKFSRQHWWRVSTCWTISLAQVLASQLYHLEYLSRNLREGILETKRMDHWPWITEHSSLPLWPSSAWSEKFLSLLSL